MLNVISWQDFIMTILILISGYYIAYFLVFYRQEITGWVNASSKPSPLPQEADDLIRQDKGDTMGKAKNPQDDRGEYLEPGDEILFARDPQHDLLHKRNNEDSAPLMGNVSDFLNEFKTLAQIISENNASRLDAEPMFKAMLEKYSGLRHTPFFDAINMHLHGICKETCEFDLHLNEVIAWWPAISK